MLKHVLLLAMTIAVSGTWANHEAYRVRTLSEIGQKPAADSAILIPISETKEFRKETQAEKTDIFLDQQEISDALNEYLQDKYHEEFDVQLETPVAITPDLEPFKHDFALGNIQVNDQRSRLKADIVFNNKPGQSLKLVARLDVMIEVPVLSHPIKPGDIINPEDIVWQKLPERRVKGKIITSLDEMVGYQPRNRTLASNDPLRKLDLIKLQTIKRGSLVLAYIDNQGISVQMQAKALDGGAAGEKIRLQNTDSNKILSGTIDAAGNVKILTTTAYASADSGGSYNVQ